MDAIKGSGPMGIGTRAEVVTPNPNIVLLIITHIKISTAIVHGDIVEVASP